MAGPMIVSDVRAARSLDSEQARVLRLRPADQWQPDDLGPPHGQKTPCCVRIWTIEPQAHGDQSSICDVSPDAHTKLTLTCRGGGPVWAWLMTSEACAPTAQLAFREIVQSGAVGPPKKFRHRELRAWAWNLDPPHPTCTLLSVSALANGWVPPWVLARWPMRARRIRRLRCDFRGQHNVSCPWAANIHTVNFAGTLSGL
jgi:hypothetical protein